MGGTQSTTAQKEIPVDSSNFERDGEAFNLASPEELVSQPLDQQNSSKRANGGNDSSDEEKESFQGWRSSASVRGSMSSQGGVPSSTPTANNTGTAGGAPSASPSTRSSLPSKTSHDAPSAPSSSNWFDERPSADTPLPPSTDTTFTSASSKPPPKRQSASYLLNPPPEQQHTQHAQSERSSGSSTGRISGQHSAGLQSARSSFAVERASVEANRYSLEAFHEAHRAQQTPSAPTTHAISQDAYSQQAFASLEHAGNDAAGESLDLLLHMAGLGPELREPLAALSVLPVSTPAPAAMLARLWKVSEQHVIGILTQLAAHGVANVARLPNGELWALPQAQQLQLVQASCRDTAPIFHARLIESYTASIGGHRIPVSEIPDDGYILANIGHHLVSAGRLRDARTLLLNLAWLDCKLVTCGAAAVVADFRRYLLVSPEREVKLVLEAFQMSVGLASAHRHLGVPGLLGCLITGRLMTVPLTPEMQAWMMDQRQAARKQAAIAIAAGLPRCLPPTTPSLDQAGGLQRLALKGHRGAITKVLLTPSGTEAVSISADGTARLWDLEIGDCVLTMEGHAGAVNDAAITADGSLLVTCSDDGTARAYELERGQCLRVLAGHEGAINTLAMDPFGRFVATGGADGTARVFDLSSARALHVLPAPGGVCSLALSPCTRYLLLGCGDGIVRVFDVISGQSMGNFQGHTNWVSAVAFMPDGKRVVSASHDGTVRLWSMRSGRCVRTFEGHTGRISALALSTDGTIAASASDDGTVRVWTLKTGSCRVVLQGHRAWVAGVALSQENNHLVSASGDGTAICWNLDTGEPVRVLEGHSGPVLAAAVTRRGRFAVTASEDCSLRVWDFSAHSSHTPKWHEGRIRTLAACDGLVVATAGDDCVARLWDAALGEYRGLLQGHAVPIRWSRFSADGSQLMTASPDREVRVWDAATMEVLHHLPAQQGSRVKCLAADAELNIAAVCLFDGTVTIWDLKQGQPAAILQARGVRDETVGHTSAVNEILMTADGSTVVTMSKDATARVWDVSAQSCRHVLRGHTDAISGGCLSNDGSLLATHSFDHSVRLWSVDNGECLAVIPLGTEVASMALSRCGWRLAGALADGSVVLCDLQHPEKGCIHVTGHQEQVTGLSFSADGAVLVSCSMDCTARVVETSTGSLQGLFVSDCGLTCCHYDSVTECVVAGTDRGVVHFIDVSQPPPLLAETAAAAVSNGSCEDGDDGRHQDDNNATTTTTAAAAASED